MMAERLGVIHLFAVHLPKALQKTKRSNNRKLEKSPSEPRQAAQLAPYIHTAFLRARPTLDLQSLFSSTLRAWR